MAKSADPSLTNVFRSIGREQPEPAATVVKGNVPQWLKGSFLRNGPGLFEVGSDSYNHVFDGLALLHRFDILDGIITYQSKFLQSDVYKKNMATNRIVCSEFGTLAHPDPCKNIFQWFFSYFVPPLLEDNCNISWIQLGDEYYVCTESTNIRKADPKDLETGKRDDYQNYIAVNTATSHPHKLEDGSVINIGSSFGMRANYNIIRFPPANKGEEALKNASIDGSIPIRYRLYPSYYHSFAITQNYVIFLEQPLYLNVMKLATAKFMGNTLQNTLEYHPQCPAIFHIIEQESGKPIDVKFFSSAFFCFHHINAYEHDGHIVLDVCAHNDIEIIESMSFSHLKKTTSGHIPIEVRRFVFPLAMNKDAPIGSNLVSLKNTDATAVKMPDHSIHVTGEKMAEKGVELPVINYGLYNGKMYRYCYGVSDTADSGRAQLPVRLLGSCLLCVTKLQQ
ncbi:beta,beta-carotene 15,15'-dioxygenase-like isoform X2 [Ptychodera flava]|uniref:beta,beta-carotene 15,15'-dioxygenase-like isoform X2 n=1 Tax=Ptychodera flava TaxID=63121 RepID=UPI00396A5ABB